MKGGHRRGKVLASTCMACKHGLVGAEAVEVDAAVHIGGERSSIAVLAAGTGRVVG